MINDKKLFFPLFTPRNIGEGDSNKYPQHVFLGVFNTVVFFNFSNRLPHLEPRNHSIQIAVITNFIVIFNVGIKRFDCNILL